MSVYRVSTRDAIDPAESRGSPLGFWLVAGAALLPAAHALIAFTTSYGDLARVPLDHATDIVLVLGLFAIGALSRRRDVRTLALVAGGLWLVSAVSELLIGAGKPPSAPVLFRVEDYSRSAAGASSMTATVVALAMLRAAAWLSACGVSYVVLRRFSRPRWWPAVAASAGLTVVGTQLEGELPRIHTWGCNHVVEAHSWSSLDGSVSGIALAGAFVVAALALRSGIASETTARSSRLETSDRTPAAAAEDLRMAGPMTRAVVVVVFCVAAFVAATPGVLFGAERWALFGGSVALCVALEQLRAADRRAGSLATTVAACTRILLAFANALVTRQRFLGDAAALSLAVALVGVAFATPRIATQSGAPVRRWLVLTLALSGVAMGCSGLGGMITFGAWPPERVFVSVGYVVALVFAAVASRRASTLEGIARVRIAIRKREAEAELE